MAPELALQAIASTPSKGIILDPFCGSGTVLRAAAIAGRSAIGVDTDPLAILMSRVSSYGYTTADFEKAEISLREALQTETVGLPSWIANCAKTKKFVEFWFATEQIEALSHLARGIDECCVSARQRDLLKLTLSRIIITKKRGASLAWDVSHSRPHRKKTNNTFDVYLEYYSSLRSLKRLVLKDPITASSDVIQGNAKDLAPIADQSVDAVITSPPYLNAIDYMRGHKLSLVWLGYALDDLNDIKAKVVGLERMNWDVPTTAHDIYRKITDQTAKIARRHEGMIVRYVNDLLQFSKELSRVMKPNGLATLVIGDSCLRGNFVSNSLALQLACEHSGMTFHSLRARSLPSNKRYLPITSSSLSNRMRTENVLKMVS